MRLTIPHYYDFGADRVHVGDDLVRAEAWDALRLNTDGAFSVPATRAAWEEAAAGRPEIEARAERIVAVARERGARRLAPHRPGAGRLPPWVRRAPAQNALVPT